MTAGPPSTTILAGARRVSSDATTLGIASFRTRSSGTWPAAAPSSARQRIGKIRTNRHVDGGDTRAEGRRDRHRGRVAMTPPNRAAWVSFALATLPNGAASATSSAMRDGMIRIARLPMIAKIALRGRPPGQLGRPVVGCPITSSTVESPVRRTKETKGPRQRLFRSADRRRRALLRDRQRPASPHISTRGPIGRVDAIRPSRRGRDRRRSGPPSRSIRPRSGMEAGADLSSTEPKFRRTGHSEECASGGRWCPEGRNLPMPLRGGVAR